MRQMERSTKDFADWRKEREKEVMQLRRQVGTLLVAIGGSVTASACHFILSRRPIISEGSQTAVW